MTIKAKALKFRLHPSSSLILPQEAAPNAARPAPAARQQAPLQSQSVQPQTVRAEAVQPEPVQPAAPQDGAQDNDPALAAIRAEGLSSRQLRLAKRVAHKHGLSVSSELDAVAQLRARGIDPFQASTLLDLGRPAGEAEAPMGRVQLPQTVQQKGRAVGAAKEPSPEAERKRASEIMKMQRDIVRRRRRNLAMLFARLAFFVIVPTLVAGWYFFRVATPMFATNSEFVIQQAQSQGAGATGMASMFQGSSLATQTDSMTVQSYLMSRAAMLRLDAEHGFRAHFSDPAIDPLQRLPADATNEDMYKLYSDHVKISYDPTQGVVKMEVIAVDPATSQIFSEALIRYAEEQVDQLSLRLRAAQMEGARDSYQAAETRRADALAALLAIQEQAQQIDPAGETAARTAQISALDTERQQLQLQLQQRLSVARPNEAQVEDLRRQIGNIESMISGLRSEMTLGSDTGTSLAARNTELRLAEENYNFQTVMVQAALTQMETAQIEANRQVRFLETGVAPVAPDQASYPRALENTLLTLLILAGIYLMLSLTVSILREQVTS